MSVTACVSFRFPCGRASQSRAHAARPSQLPHRWAVMLLQPARGGATRRRAWPQEPCKAHASTQPHALTHDSGAPVPPGNHTPPTALQLPPGLVARPLCAPTTLAASATDGTHRPVAVGCTLRPTHSPPPFAAPPHNAPRQLGGPVGAFGDLCIGVGGLAYSPNPAAHILSMKTRISCLFALNSKRAGSETKSSELHRRALLRGRAPHPLCHS